jgi:hypothetical protein
MRRIFGKNGPILHDKDLGKSYGRKPGKPVKRFGAKERARAAKRLAKMQAGGGPEL